MKKNNYIALLLALFLVATSVGCSAGVQNVASNKPSDATSDQTVLQEAAEWFKEQTTYWRALSVDATSLGENLSARCRENTAW